MAIDKSHVEIGKRHFGPLLMSFRVYLAKSPPHLCRVYRNAVVAVAAQPPMIRSL